MTRTHRILFIVIAAIGVTVTTATLNMAQELETETARLPKKRTIEVAAGFEYQTSSEGTESASPLLFEAGIFDRLELVMEPVMYTAIRPKIGHRATGIGDLEVTLIGLALEEHPFFPALAFAAEIKIPMAKDRLIGTGEYDYTGYLIFSKRFGKLDTHFNIGYSLIGAPSGVTVHNVWNFAAAARYIINDRYDVFTEVLGNTAASSEAESTVIQASELIGNEYSVTIGAGWHVTPSVHLTLGLTYDNNSAFLVHPGMTIKW